MNKLVIDLLCLDSVVILLKKNLYKEYQEIYFCRETRIGAGLKNLIRRRVELKQLHLENESDKVQAKLINHRYQLLDKLLRSVKSGRLEKLSRLLKVCPDKTMESYKVFSWKDCFYPSEAASWASYLKADVIINRSFVDNSFGKIRATYRQLSDGSKVIARAGYLFETAYRKENTIKAVILTLLGYLIALVMMPMNVLKKKNDPKEILVQVIRNNVDINKKSDLFWLSSVRVFNRILLVTRNKVNLVGNSSKVENLALESNFIQGLKKEKYCFRNKDFCINYLKTALIYLRVLFFCLVKRESHSFILWLKDVFLFQTAFKTYKAKVFISNHSYFNSAAILACAMSKVVYTRSTWSNQMAPHAHIATSADVFFAWGESSKDTYSRSGAKGVNFIKTGFIDGSLIQRHGKIKKTVAEGKVVLGFVDNLTAFDLYNLPVQLKLCLEMLIDLLDRHSRLVVLYKPKSGDLKEVEKLNLSDLINPYIKEGRFKVLTGEKSYDHMPVELADKVDLVLGYPISTAATETMIAGVPSFHLNLTGLRENYWEKNGFDEAIFYSIEEAKERLSKYIENPDRIPRPSEALLKTVNHFNDFRAKERMQKYIEFLCEGEELSVSQRIQNANQKYYQLDIVKNVGKSEQQ